MPRQLHGKSSKTQGPEARTDLSETPHHGLGVRDVPRKAGHHVLLGTKCSRRVLCKRAASAVCRLQAATRGSPYTENGPARAATARAAAGSEALPAAVTVLVLLCFGGSGIFWVVP